MYSALYAFYLSKKQARIREVAQQQSRSNTFTQHWWRNRSSSTSMGDDQLLPPHMCAGPIAVLVRKTTEDKLQRFIQLLQDPNISLELREQTIAKFIKFVRREEEARNTALA